MDREGAITLAKNLLERRIALHHQLEAVDGELQKLSTTFGLVLDLDGGVVT